MGAFCTEVQLAAPLRPDRRDTVKLLVDSGSVYTWVSSAALRGAYTLEGFGLAIDPVQRRLIPAILYGAAAEGAAVG